MKKWSKNIIVVPSMVLMILFTFNSCEDVPFERSLTEGEIIQGLKDALSHGTDTAVANLSIQDGYFQDELIKILLPAEAQPVYNVLSSVPILSDIVDETVLSINRAAEDAANEAKPIFVSAITDITIEDGLGILQGDDTAATHYLRDKTYDGLFTAFKPKIENSLSKDLVLGISAEESYEKMINTYNTASINGLLWNKIETNSLSEHTTNRALKGLFVKVGDEEKLIREDPLHRVTDILDRVFGDEG